MRIRDYSGKNVSYKIGPTYYQDIANLPANRTKINCNTMNSTGVDFEEKLEGVYMSLAAAFLLIPFLIGCCYSICCFVSKEEHDDSSTSSVVSPETSTGDDATCELTFANSSLEGPTSPQMPGQMQNQTNAADRSGVVPRILNTAKAENSFFTQRPQPAAAGMQIVENQKNETIPLNLKLLKILTPKGKREDINAV